MEEAQAALNDISQKELAELKVMAMATPAVLMVCQISFYLYVSDIKEQRNDDWPTLKGPKLLGDMKLLANL